MTNWKRIQAVFIDRDGTIGGSDEVVIPGEFKLFKFSTKSLEMLKNAQIPIFSFTNQPGISRGEAQFQDFVDELSSFGFDKIYICPHQNGEGCLCRKPSSGMLNQAAQDYKLVLKNCAVIGDRWTVMIAAQRVGCIKVLVKTGSGERELAKFRNNQFYGEWLDAAPDYIAEDLMDAVNWLLM
ncbi:HAD-IIIA family hydrolase [Paenibacillus sp. V4I7]|uniref:HAD-IIIA family hydrolase n=1 Tax=Paenibacillus sp. V4I7 TaxID=3042307 RepID=UPI002785BD53|nr:HAD-IIIA family hydrolase [Paenibacillus sp. V4I7]MDQ0899355.1 histidinol-phosphate phosphatase family protein [Paenibacillus sp. V4I7]